jgi:signal transduction histidine kinase
MAARIHSQMQELNQMGHQRRELLANVSHDLRTPLATLQSHLETLSVNAKLPRDEQEAYLAVAFQQCRRLVSLVDKLLTLAKLDARQITISPEPFQPAELMQDVAMKWALAARRAGVTVSAEPPIDGAALVVGDVGWIEKVLDNLIDNAVRYAGGGGRVTLRVTAGSEAVRIEVHDGGPGIAETDRARIFDPLYRGDPSRSSDTGQAGLGLSIARAILALHGQTIDFVTTANEGTTFFFELRRVARGGAKSVPPEELSHRRVAPR